MNTLPTSLPERFYIDLAIGAQPFEDICTLYSLDPEAISQHADDPMFVQRLAQAEQAVADDGRAFRARCKRVVHDAIPRLQEIIHSPDVPAATQLTAFQSLVKYSGMEPEKQAQQTTQGPSISLTIIGPGGEAHRIEAAVQGQVIENEEPNEDDELAPLASLEESSMFLLPETLA